MSTTNPSTMAPAARNPTRTLIAFGGAQIDNAIATDFVAISKALINNNLNPTCLSGTDLRDVMGIVGYPLVFGREDLGSRTVVYTHQEAAGIPFYHLAGASLKNSIITWISNAAADMCPGDRMVLVLLGHGTAKGDMILSTRGRTEVLTKSEIIVSLRWLPRNVRVTVMNESCYSGSWSEVASNVGDGGKRAVLAENACEHNELSWNYYSSSGRFRCSLFAVAWLNEITTNAEGRVSQHISRIKEEVDFVPPHQKTNTPVITTSSRSLRSFNTSHFILPPNIAEAIINTATDTHEDQLRARSQARKLWKTLWSSKTMTTQATDPGAANSASSDFGDMDLALINQYLEELGTEAQSHGKSGIANVCLSVLEGTATDDVKHRLAKTIVWQDEQMLKTDALLQHLVSQNFLSRHFDHQTAKTHLVDFQEEVQAVKTLFGEEPELLQSPSWEDGYISMIYPDAFEYFVNVVTCNKLLSPESFNPQAITSESSTFSREIAKLPNAAAAPDTTVKYPSAAASQPRTTREGGGDRAHDCV